MIVQNQTGGGGPKIPEGTLVIVAIYTNAQSNVSTNFIVPQTGTYKITVIGAGGNGDGAYDADRLRDNYSGAGGGSGGWGTKILQLLKNDSVPVTCNTTISSFGAYVSAQSGKNASSETGGAGGAVSGADVSNPGTKGSDGTSGQSSGYGGNGANVSAPSGSPFLTSAYGKGGSSNGYSSSYRYLSAYDPISSGPFNAFGAGGGGGALSISYEGEGSDGGPGAVIIELLLKGGNDT